MTDEQQALEATARTGAGGRGSRYEGRCINVWNDLEGQTPAATQDIRSTLGTLTCRTLQDRLEFCMYVFGTRSSIMVLMMAWWRRARLA